MESLMVYSVILYLTFYNTQPFKMSFSLFLKEKTAQVTGNSAAPSSGGFLPLRCRAMVSLLLDHLTLTGIAMTELIQSTHMKSTSLNSDFGSLILNTPSVPGKAFSVDTNDIQAFSPGVPPLPTQLFSHTWTWFRSGAGTISPWRKVGILLQYRNKCDVCAHRLWVRMIFHIE